MPNEAASLCSECGCSASPVTDSGYECCPGCGTVVRRELDVNHMSFLQSVSKLHTNAYTRTARFSEKIVAALLRKTCYKPRPNMILYLNSCKRANQINEPEDLLLAIANYKPTARRPHMHATSLWEATVGTEPLPQLAESEERFIKLLFEEIFYVWTRLNFARPRLPMGQAIVLIVKTFKLSSEAHYLVRFIRKLKCDKRRARYALLFKKCLEAIINDEHRRERFRAFAVFREYTDSRKSASRGP